jgi:hypothetical protein
MIYKNVRLAGMHLLISLSSALFAQGANFGYTEEPVSPRAVGMGCTGAATAQGGFAYYNPAAIPAAESSFIAFDYGQQWSDRNHTLLETGWIFPQWFIGASFMTQSVDFQLTDYTGSDILPGKGTEQASALSLALGWRGERYTIAAAANGLHHHIYDRDAYALSASGGMTFAVLPGRLSAGAALVQAGRLHRGFYDSRFEFHRDQMPTTGRIGVNWNDTIVGKLPVNIAVDAAYSSNYRKVNIPVGVEIRPLKPLAIRVGKRFNFESDLITLGVGIKWQNIAFDASFTPSTLEGDADLKWLMGLRYSLAPIKLRKQNGQEPAQNSGSSQKSPPPVIDTTGKATAPVPSASGSVTSRPDSSERAHDTTAQPAPVPAGQPPVADPLPADTPAPGAATPPAVPAVPAASQLPAVQTGQSSPESIAADSSSATTAPAPVLPENSTRPAPLPDTIPVR